MNSDKKIAVQKKVGKKRILTGTAKNSITVKEPQ